MQFWKYQGAGNDFIMVDQRGQEELTRADTERIRFLCDRHFGIGADGLILLQQHPHFDFEMIYFNADGRESSMCGNGGRCIVAFAKQLGIDKPKYRFMAIDGEHEAVIGTHEHIPGTEWVELKMSNVSRVEALPTEAGSDFILDTGSPHYVRFVPAVDALDMEREGQAIRYSERFHANGINVNMVQEDAGHLCIRTYERGVEGETLACGTGVTAAALAHYRHRNNAPGKAEIPVKARGGDLLVRFQMLENGDFTDIWLCGPARQVFSGNIPI